MNPSHLCSGKECLQCVLEWYRLGSSSDDDDAIEDEKADVEDLAPESPPPDTIIPETLDPVDLGSQVMETEFDDQKSPESSPAVHGGCRSDEVESSCTKYLNGYLKRMDEKRQKMTDQTIAPVHYKENDEETPSDMRFTAYAERFIKRR